MRHDLNNLPNQPACLGLSPERLDSMSASELADAMEQAVDAMTEETYDPTVIDAYLEALDRKIPVPDDLNTKASYSDFLTRLQPLAAEEPRSRYPKRGGKLFRTFLVAALISACLLGSMAIAQAAGINVLGAIAHWTDSVFGFGSLSSEHTLSNPSKTAYAVDLDIPEEYKKSGSRRALMNSRDEDNPGMRLSSVRISINTMYSDSEAGAEYRAAVTIYA